MSETYTLLRIVSENKDLAQRIHFYLDSNTRPDFEEEVPQNELAFFKKIESLDSPGEIVWQNNRCFDAHFENIEESDIEEIASAISLFEQSKIYFFFMDDEEYKIYKQLINGEYKILYIIENDETIDEKLWDLDWDHRAMDYIISQFG